METKTNELVRQRGSNALISNDTKSYQAYIQQRERNNKIDQLSQEMNTLKTELSEIKYLLVKLTNGK